MKNVFGRVTSVLPVMLAFVQYVMQGTTKRLRFHKQGASTPQEAFTHL